MYVALDHFTAGENNPLKNPLMEFRRWWFGLLCRVPSSVPDLGGAAGLSLCLRDGRDGGGGSSYLRDRGRSDSCLEALGRSVVERRR